MNTSEVQHLLDALEVRKATWFGHVQKRNSECIGRMMSLELAGRRPK